MRPKSSQNYGTELERGLARKARVDASRSRGGHGYLAAIMLALFALFSVPAQSSASELREQTLAEWNDYVHSACLRTEERGEGSPFLDISEQPERRERARAGEIIVWREGDKD